MAEIVLGPMLRWVGATEATVWLETDGPCEVGVLGRRERTFRVGHHHYALVHLAALEEDSATPYAVELDGERRWPPADDERPAPRIRTLGPGGTLSLAFGSCRVAVPHEPPYTLTKDEDDEGKERDALHALAARMLGSDESEWPDVLVMLGDQVYVDEGSPETRAFIRARRDTSEPPGEETLDFEEYARLYRESWGDPQLRWLLSTVPSAMIFDDHEMSDDWNTSEAWMREQHRRPWYRRRLVAGYMSYWLYQHIGNLSPHELAEDPVWRRVREADDGEPALRAFAEQAASSIDGTRWSFYRDLGRTRLVMIDSRGGRLLAEGHRRMIDDAEWRWVVEHSTGDVDHLVIGSSLPVFIMRGMHYIEAWSEAVCAGAWGRLAARLCERLRRTIDLEHWPSFRASFEQLVGLLREVGSGQRGGPPASVVVLGGDVHHAYLAQVAFPAAAGVTTPVYQAVCSPFRNPLDAHERRVIRAMASETAGRITRLLARLARVPDPPVRLRLAGGPVFDNQVATLDIRDRRCDLRIERVDRASDEPRLETTVSRRLA